MLSVCNTRLRAFFANDISVGIVLISAALLAIAMDNSPLAWLYNGLLNTPFVIGIGGFDLNKPLLLWINDGLMAIFFFHVALEIKREMVEGNLSSWQQASLPAIAAVGGMIAPALIYLAMNAGDPVALRGWAIPAATDIAFAVGVLALLGTRAPSSLKIFLLALAILDDLGAIVIIALFYTDELALMSLGIAVLGVAVLWMFNQRGVRRFGPYLIVGVIMWVCVLKSGVHATLTGVVLAFFIPLSKDESGHSLLHSLEHKLAPWVTFGVMPLFAFANAGVSLAGLSFEALLAPIPLGIAMGLFVGKQMGILGFSWLGTRLGLCRLPRGVSWSQMHGVAVLGGIGFTMSLFIGTLSFADPSYAASVRLGVLSGSFLSGVVGYLILRFSMETQKNELVRPSIQAATIENTAIRN